MCFKISVFVIFALILGIKGEGYYSVLAPGHIRPLSDYHVAIGTHGTSLPTRVTVAILGTARSTGRAHSYEQSLVVEPYATRVALIQIGDIGPGDYRLVARGNGGISFETSSYLNYTAKSYSVFIVTDRQVYEPGTKILFRAIVLNVNLKPAAEVRDEEITVQISDGKNNIVKQWDRVIATRGVFNGELPLSERPALGDWTVTVKIHDQTYNKTIQVVEYVLPKFRVDIETKKDVLFAENKITATIHSRHNYSKPQTGLATITVYPTIVSGVIQPIFQNPVRKVVPIDGTITVEFDITNELKLSDEYERTVVIDAMVEESLTGRRQNNSVEIKLHKYEYKIELMKSADYYKPGMKYTAYVKVSKHDGRAIDLNNRNVVVRHGYHEPNEIYKDEVFKLDKNGIAELVFYPPRYEMRNQSALRIEAEYMDLKEWFTEIPPSFSPSSTYIQATIITERPIVNREIEILLNCTEPIGHITYEVFGRGDLLLANTLRTKNEHTYAFRFTATRAMAPIARLVVHYIRPDGEFVADSLDIEVEGLLSNYVDIQTSALEVRPDSDIDITINAQPNSYIGLMAIDKNTVDLIKSGNDLTSDDIIKELLTYDSASTLYEHRYGNIIWRPGSGNAANTIMETGAVLLTNSAVNRHQPILEDDLRTIQPFLSSSGHISTVKPDKGPAIQYGTATRPPLAGPYAFSRIPKTTWNYIPRINVEKMLQNTWLFANLSSGFEGKTTVRRKVPNEQATWVLTAFSLDPLHGLGIINKPSILKVSKPLSVNVDLPFAVRLGETLTISAFIENNQDIDITAEVNFHNTEQKFEILPKLNDSRAELFKRKFVKVKRNGGSPVSFLIKPKALGTVQIKLTVASDKHIATTEKDLKIIADGEPQYFTKTLLVDLRKSSTFKSNVTLDIPKNIIPNSLDIQVAAFGDPMAPVIANIDKLIRLPRGCGEQNLLKLHANMIALNYLKRTGNLGETMRQKYLENIETAYQNQMSYRRDDGSFSQFGRTDNNGSIWLTSLVAYSLRQAQNFIYVDETVITNALRWLADKQFPNGAFTEIGNIVNRPAQNPEGQSLALSSVAALAFWENRNMKPEYSAIAQRALDYVSRYLDENENIFSITIASYAIHATRHAAQSLAFNLLEIKSQVNDSTKFWAEKLSEKDQKNPWNFRPKSLDIEMTSYALLTYLEKGLIEDSIPVLRYLVSKQNEMGGFESTRDTIMALTAISRFMERITQLTDARIKFAYRPKETKNINVNRGSTLIVQENKIDTEARLINVTADGSGLAFFRVTYKYNTNVTGPWPLFTLDPQVDKNSDIHHLQLSICSAFVSRNLSAEPESNMAVMEVNLPSGYTADVDSLPIIGQKGPSENVKLVETDNGDTKVLLYFDSLTRDEHCPTISAFKTFKVADQKNIAVLLYDYYDTSRKARVFYNNHRSTPCDICEATDCENLDCEKRASRINQQIGSQNGDKDGKGSANKISTESIIYLTILYLTTRLF